MGRLTLKYNFRNTVFLETFFAHNYYSLEILNALKICVKDIKYISTTQYKRL